MATEKRLIDAISARDEFADNLAYMGSEVKRKLNIAPTVDAVEVVRCKDCGESDPSDAVKGRVWCRRMCRYMIENGFCSEGGRKDDER